MANMQINALIDVFEMVMPIIEQIGNDYPTMDIRNRKDFENILEQAVGRLPAAHQAFARGHLAELKKMLEV